MKTLRLPIGVFMLVAVSSPVRAADDPYAAQLFEERCASCHVAAAGGAARIPPVSQLKAMTPTAILKALESGVMRSQAAALSTNERQAIPRRAAACLRSRWTAARRSGGRHLLDAEIAGHAAPLSRPL